jgi:hypothetical protein
MPAILRGHVRFNSKADGEALLQPGELTTAEAAAIADCSTERIRQLVKQYRLGSWSSRLRMYVVDHAKLDAHLASRKRKPRP